jgi:predicted ATPase
MVLLLDDLLGIADPKGSAAPDRTRCSAAPVDRIDQHHGAARTQPGLNIVEDVHWIDAVSRIDAGRLPVRFIPRAPVDGADHLRPEYEGALRTGYAGAHAIALAPLADSEDHSVIGELLGSDHLGFELARSSPIGQAGKPVFAEGKVRRVGAARGS